MRQRDTILLTGFGPFPGVSENASARLVPKLAHLAARRFSAHRVVSRILPTEWDKAPERLKAYYVREQPKLVLHFGVSRAATGYVIETVARNSCRPAEDAAGVLPKGARVLADGPETIPARLPVEDILKRLHAIGVAAVTSDDAGGYLCNALLYHSLLLAAERERVEGVGFFHIPEVIRPAALRGGVDAGPRFDWGTALIGGLEIIRTSLGRPPPSRGHVKVR